eukprot:TRINITY_DN6297_c0_g1_i5.p1 TRINITY_DN6297_c0_g1~~TRINITY_DN6297_c0_g1_i5.p1  ORF type:complete len:1452 (-),score=211.50 TRINITY_DN6297_c0_g1_i5:137-4078(-)
MLTFDSFSYRIFYPKSDGLIYQLGISGPANGEEVQLTSTPLSDVCSLSFDYAASLWYFHAEGLTYGTVPLSGSYYGEDYGDARGFVSYGVALVSCKATYMARTTATTTLESTLLLSTTQTTTAVPTTQTMTAMPTTQTMTYTNSTLTYTATETIVVPAVTSSTQTTTELASDTGPSLGPSSSTPTVWITTRSDTSTMTATDMSHADTTSTATVPAETSTMTATDTSHTHTTSDAKVSFTTGTETSTSTAMEISHTHITSDANISFQTGTETSTSTATEVSHIHTTSTATLSLTSTTATTSETNKMTELSIAFAQAAAVQMLEVDAAAEQAAIGALFRQAGNSTFFRQAGNSTFFRQAGNSTSRQVILTILTPSGTNLSIALLPEATGNALEFSVPAEDGEFAASVSLPSAVLEQLLGVGPAALAIGQLSEDAAETLEAATGQGQPKLTSAPLSITLYGPDGEEMKLVNLPEPILLTLKEDATEDDQCVFWDEEANTWSTEGITRIHSAGTDVSEPLVCATTHLSIFGSILKSIVRAITCSNMQALFSLQGLERLKAHGWWRRPPALVLWCYLAVAVLSLRIAWGADKRPPEILARAKDVHEAAHSDAKHLTSTRLQHSKQTGPAAWLAMLEAMVFGLGSLVTRIGSKRSSKPTDLMTHVSSTGSQSSSKPAGLMTQVSSTGSQSSSKRLMTHVNSAGSQMSSQLSALMMMPLKNLLQSSVRRSVCAEEEFVKKFGSERMKREGQRAIHDTMHGRPRARMVMFFKARHPVIAATVPLVGISHSRRVAVVVASILGAAAANAVFFQSAGGVAGLDDPAECQVQRTLIELATESFTVGCVSGLFTSIPTALLLKLGSRGSVVVGLSLRQVRTRRTLRAILFWTFMWLYWLLSLFVVATFIASVTALDANRWLTSFGVSTMMKLVLFPCLLALGLELWLSLLLRFRPTKTSEVVHQQFNMQGPPKIGSSASLPNLLLAGVESRKSASYHTLSSVPGTEQVPRMMSSASLPSLLSSSAEYKPSTSQHVMSSSPGNYDEPSLHRFGSNAGVQELGKELSTSKNSAWNTAKSFTDELRPQHADLSGDNKVHEAILQKLCGRRAGGRVSAPESSPPEDGLSEPDQPRFLESAPCKESSSSSLRALSYGNANGLGELDKPTLPESARGKGSRSWQRALSQEMRDVVKLLRSLPAPSADATQSPAAKTPTSFHDSGAGSVTGVALPTASESLRGQEVASPTASESPSPRPEFIAITMPLETDTHQPGTASASSWEPGKSAVRAARPKTSGSKEAQSPQSVVVPADPEAYYDEEEQLRVFGAFS